MANILSQDEIDALLGAMERGELVDEDEESSEGKSSKVEAYNFRRPNLISREKLRGFNSMHDQFLRQFQQNLSLLMRTNVEVNIVSIDQIIYQEFISSLDEVTHMMLFGLDPLPGSAVLEIKLSLVYGLIDLLLGGQGDVETEVRDMTEIERAIIEPFMILLQDQIETVWNEVYEITFRKLRNETDPEMVQSAPAEAPMVIVTLAIKVGNASGVINVGYPLPMVQSLLSSMDSKDWENDNYYGKVAPKNYRMDILSVISDMPIPMKVNLGEIDMMGEDLYELEQGDILVLNKKVSENLVLEVGGEPFSKVVPGKVGKSLAVKAVKSAGAEQYKALESLLGTEQLAKTKPM